MFMGYLNNDYLNSKHFNDEGWYITNDIVTSISIGLTINGAKRGGFGPNRFKHSL